MGMNFFYGNGYEIAKPVSARPVAIPSDNNDCNNTDDVVQRGKIVQSFCCNHGKA